MASYLLVARQTAQSSQLLAAAEELTRDDPGAEFVLLVPATPGGDLSTSDQGKANETANRQAESARAWLQDAGLRMVGAKVGDPDPVRAISAELQGRTLYVAIAISTLPQGVSQWLRMDVVSRVRRQFPSIRVEHVVSEMPGTTPPS
jgi:hypothetical protein